MGISQVLINPFFLRVIHIQIRYTLSLQDAAKKGAVDFVLNSIFAEDAEQDYLLGVFTIRLIREK